jgi:hypothetical protein
LSFAHTSSVITALGSQLGFSSVSFHKLKPIAMLDWFFPDGQENADEVVKQVCIKILKGAAEGVSFLPVPGVAVVPHVVNGLIILVQNVQVNKCVVHHERTPVNTDTRIGRRSPR